MFQDEGRFGLLGTPRRCWAPHGIRPVVGARLERKYLCAFSAANTVFANLDAVETTLTNSLVALEADPNRTQSMTGFKWIISISLNAL